MGLMSFNFVEERARMGREIDRILGEDRILVDLSIFEDFF